MANQGDYVSFLFVSPLNQSFGFRTYNNEMGQEIGFLEGKRPDGSPIYRRWKFTNDGGRTVTVHKNKTDLNGVKAVDFLRGSPNCQGSANGAFNHGGEQIDIYFKEMNEEADAKVGLDSEVAKLEAQNLALKVKGQDFVDLCALIGVFNKEESVMRFSLLDYAKRNPEAFNLAYNDKVRKLKSILRQGVACGVINKEGRMLTWEGQLLGVDEETAVIKLDKEEKMFDAIKKHIETKK